MYRNTVKIPVPVDLNILWRGVIFVSGKEKMANRNILAEYDAAYTGRLVKRIRKHMDLTVEQLAFMVGCSRNHMYSIERGAVKPSLETVMNLAKALDISVDELLYPNAGNFESQKISDGEQLKKRIMMVLDMYDTSDQK